MCVCVCVCVCVCLDLVREQSFCFRFLFLHGDSLASFSLVNLSPSHFTKFFDMSAELMSRKSETK